MSAELEWGQPWVLLGLLLLVPYALLRARRLRREDLPWAPLQYLPAGGPPPGRLRGAFGKLLLPAEVVLLAVVLLALAGPHTVRELELIEAEGIDVVLVLDVSLSMLAEDFPPNRLEALRTIARDFVARSGGHRLGMVVFAGDPYVQTPLTTDHRSLLEMLDGVTVYAIDQAKSGGTAVGDALLVAARALERSKVEGRDQALVLITDGESNSGIEASLAARYVAEQGVRLYAIGIGGEEPVAVTFEGEPVGTEGGYRAFLDERELLSIADASGGRYYRAADVGALEAIFGHLSRLESAPLEVREVSVRAPLASRLALVALPLFALALALGGVVARRPLK